MCTSGVAASHGCFAVESEFLYGNQKWHLFPYAGHYNKIIPPSFPGEMNHINRLIVTLLSLWFQSHLPPFLALQEWNEF